MTYYHTGASRPNYTVRIGHEIRRLHAEGYTERDIGSMLGIAESAVRAALPPSRPIESGAAMTEPRRRHVTPAVPVPDPTWRNPPKE